MGKRVNFDFDGSPLVLQDMLSLVGIDVPENVIITWTRVQQNEAAYWAGAAYLKASDNPVRVPPRPEFLTPYLL